MPDAREDGFREALNPSYNFTTPARSAHPVLIERDAAGPMLPVIPARTT